MRLPIWLPQPIAAPTYTACELRRQGRGGTLRTARYIRSKCCLMTKRSSPFAGYAWEELHGDTAWASGDLIAGQQQATESGMAQEDLMNEARHFVRRAGERIRCAATGILAYTPRSGLLEGCMLQALVDRFRVLRGTARQEVNSRRGRAWDRPS